MKSIVFLTISSLLISAELFAGANVQLHATDISQVTFYDRASNHPEYAELRVRGEIRQFDAVVNGLPSPLPQTIRLLVTANDILL
jgi:hypothetical protein